jgi:hypothetical protein
MKPSSPQTLPLSAHASKGSEMSEHTSLPWRVEQGTGLVWGNCTVFEDGTPDRLGVPVTNGQSELYWGRGNGRTYEEMEANAAFIVRAVNAHDALVEYVRSSASAGCATAEHLLKLHDIKEPK